jgi:hypothetical protein
MLLLSEAFGLLVGGVSSCRLILQTYLNRPIQVMTIHAPMP